jgi:hypothetical protein
MTASEWLLCAPSWMKHAVCSSDASETQHQCLLHASLLQAVEEWRCADSGMHTQLTRPVLLVPAGGDRAQAAPAPPGGSKKVVAAPQGPAALFAPDDWACPSCGNMNWARRSKCNMCQTSKPGTMDMRREGNAGGFKELDESELEAAKQRRKQFEENDGDMCGGVVGGSRGACGFDSH